MAASRKSYISIPIPPTGEEAAAAAASTEEGSEEPLASSEEAKPSEDTPSAPAIQIPEIIETESTGTIKWREAVLSCKTLSRLHVLVGMFDSCIKWEKSLASKKCTVCRNKDKGSEILVLCEKCDKSYHWSCLRPKPTAREPPPLWYCSACAAAVRSPAKNKVSHRLAFG